MALARVLILSRELAVGQQLAQDLMQHGCQADVRSLDDFIAGSVRSSAQGLVFLIDAGMGEQLPHLARAMDRTRTLAQASLPFMLAVVACGSLEGALLDAGCDDVIVGAPSSIFLSRRIAGLNRVGVMRRELARRRQTTERFAADKGPTEALEFDFSATEDVGRPISVLMVALDAGRAAAIDAALPNRFRRQVLTSGADALTALYLDTFDACFIVADTAGLAARELLADLRNSPSLFSLPVMLFPELAADADSDSWYKLGATDVVAVPFDAQLLDARIEFAVRIERMRRTLADGFRAKAPEFIRDSLSGVATHGFVLSHLGQLSRDMAAAFGTVPVAVVSITDLPRINEALGYEAGDSLITQVGRSIQRCLRLEDVAGRFSGASFLVLFPESTYRQAQVALGRLDAVLRNTVISLPTGDTLAVRVQCALHEWPCAQGHIGIEVLRQVPAAAHAAA